MSDSNTPYLLYPDHELDRRPRYYDGQLLESDDFVDDQRYAIDRHRRDLRAATTPGVVAGFDVTEGTDQITIGVGAAIDDLGRQIVLVSDAILPVAAEVRGTNLVLYVTYDDAPSDEAEGSNGGLGFTRSREQPTLAYAIAGEALPAHAVALAAMQVDGDGGVTADPTIRRRAGRRVPGATPIDLTTDDADPGRGSLDGALTVRVPDGTDHSPTAPALRVEGHGIVTGGLVVGEDDPQGYRGIANGDDDLVVAGRLVAGGSEGSALFALAVGGAPPAQGEGTLITQRAAVGRETVGDALALEVDGAAQISGQTELGGALTVAQSTTVARMLTVREETSLDDATTINGPLNVHGEATTDGLRVDGISEVYGNVGVTGNLTVDSTLRATGRRLDLGAGVDGRYADAGKIEYGTWQSDALCITGAGTTSTNRKVEFWAEGGLSIRGPADVTHALTASAVAADGALTTGGDLTVDGDARVDTDLDVVADGIVRGHLIVGQTGAGGYGGVTADAGALVVNGQFAAGGSAGAAIYSLAVGTDALADKEGWLIADNRIGVVNTNPQRKIDVTGTARLTGDTEVGGTLDIDGATALTGGLDVTGATRLDGTTTQGRLTVAEGSGNGIRFPNNAYGGGGDWAGLRYWRPDASGENTRLELGTGNDADDVLVLAQKSTDVVTLYNAKVGVGVSAPTYKLQVAGDIYGTGDLRLDGHIDLGAKDGSRANESHSAICYAKYNGGARELQLVGAGTTHESRIIRLWAEGGLHVQGASLFLDGQPVIRSYSTRVRIVWGAVKSDGTKWLGDGFSSGRGTGSYDADGLFKINFNPDFSGTPCVVTSQHYPTDSNSSTSWGDARDAAKVCRVHRQYCLIRTGTSGGNETYRSFHFIAIGPA